MAKEKKDNTPLQEEERKPRIKPISKPNLTSPPPTHFPFEIKNCIKKKLPPIIPDKAKFFQSTPKQILAIKIIRADGKVTLSKIKYHFKS